MVNPADVTLILLSGNQTEPVYETIAYHTNIIFGQLPDACADCTGCKKINVL